jgi:hypothetical protein
MAPPTKQTEDLARQLSRAEARDYRPMSNRSLLENALSGCTVAVGLLLPDN